MTTENNAAQAAEQEAVRSVLGPYAESYDMMTRMAEREGNRPTVSTTAVAIDIRGNMIPGVIAALSKLRAPVADERAAQEQTRAAHTDLLTYVLQDDVHNRLTPRVIDIAYTAFMQAKQPNDEDGGASDWFNDTKPVVARAIAKLRKDLMDDRAALASAPVAGVTGKVCGYTPGMSQVEIRLPAGTKISGWLELGESVRLSTAIAESAPVTGEAQPYRPTKIAVREACDLLDKIKKSHGYWGGWSSIPSVCDEAIGLLRYSGTHAAPQASEADFADAYEGAREDLAIWKRRALEAERDLRAERKTSSRLGAALNAENGPMYMGEPAPQASAEYTYARNLAVTIWEKRFKRDSPEWKPCDDLLGVLTQIDNMTAVMVAPQADKDDGQQRAAFDHPVFAFLLGEGQLHGVDFGERAPGVVGKWWWRKDLRAALSATQTEQGERDAG